MVTLSDAGQRNYYYYSGSGDVRVGFLKEVVESILGYNFNDFISNLETNQLKRGFNIDYAREKAYKQAVEAAIRTSASIPKYRKEIIDKLNSEPSLRQNTDEEIKKMKYTELSSLRKKIGLDKRGKKVTKQEPAPSYTTKVAREVLKNEPASKTAAKVIKSAQMSLFDLEPEEHEEFYSVEEARQAYPGYSLEELEKEGIHVTDPDAKEILDRYSVIEQILLYDVTINGKELTIEELTNCSKDDLLEIYNTVRKLNTITKGRTK